jgi:predicted amino acid racemase
MFGIFNFNCVKGIGCRNWNFISYDIVSKELAAEIGISFLMINGTESKSATITGMAPNAKYIFLTIITEQLEIHFNSK